MSAVTALILGAACSLPPMDTAQTAHSDNGTGTDPPPDTDSGGVTDTITEPVPEHPVSMGIDWAKDGSEFMVTLTGGSGPYDFGIIQSDTSDDWTGEDCYGGGYTTGGGENYEFCHTVNGNAATDVHCTTSFFEAGDDASLFCQVVLHDDDSGLSYYLGDAGWCAVTGPGASHWDELGCETWK